MWEDFTVKDGVICEYHGKGGDIVIPEGISAIGNSAFESCRNLTNIIAPCCDIEEDAFAHSGLENFFFESSSIL